MKHIFLQGESGVGKSTLIGKVISGLGCIRAGGFRTYFGEKRPPGEAALYMQRADREAVFDEAHIVARFFPPGESREPDAYTGRFNELGCAYINETRYCSDLLVFDECSWLESRALEFQAAVLSALDGETPVIGVYRVIREGSWTEKIPAHPRVRAVDLTAENRDKAALELLEYFRQRLIP